VAGIWPYKISARERLLLVRQAKNDDRNIRPVWLNVFDIDSSPIDEIFLQTSKHHRKFLDPIPAYLYLEMSDESETVEPGVDHTRTLQITISRAETFRLAGVLKEAGLDWDKNQYLLRAQDIVQWRNDLYELQDQAQPKEFWGTTGIEATYEVPATKFRMDSNAPTSPITIQLAQPKLVYPRDFFSDAPDGEEAETYPHG